MNSNDNRLADLQRLLKSAEDSGDASPSFEREVRRQLAEEVKVRDERVRRQRRG